MYKYDNEGYIGESVEGQEIKKSADIGKSEVHW